ncbi:hypothetical protein C8R43DRAFT_963330 [Mycena crocata]|nr:hypothetical protein C8R43DRAFT_963330 [Mycena crocata]
MAWPSMESGSGSSPSDTGAASQSVQDFDGGNDLPNDASSSAMSMKVLGPWGRGAVYSVSVGFGALGGARRARFRGTRLGHRRRVWRPTHLFCMYWLRGTLRLHYGRRDLGTYRLGRYWSWIESEKVAVLKALRRSPAESPQIMIDGWRTLKIFGTCLRPPCRMRRKEPETRTITPTSRRNEGGVLELRCRRAAQQSAGRPGYGLDLGKDGRTAITPTCFGAGVLQDSGRGRKTIAKILLRCESRRCTNMDAPEKPGRVTRSRAAKGKGAVVEPARVSPPKRTRKKKQAPATDDDEKAVVTNRKTKASPDMQTDIQTPEEKMQLLDAPEDKMQLDATAVAEDKMQLDERREEEQEQERVVRIISREVESSTNTQWRIQEQPTDDRPAQLEEHELNPVAPVAVAQADLESVSRERESGTSALRAEGLLHASPAEAELHAQYYPVSPAPMAAQQASSAPTWETIPLAGPGLSSAVPVPVGVAQGVPGPAYGGRGVPELERLPRVDFKTLLPRMDFRRFPARSTHAGMIRPVAETTERTPSPSPTRRRERTSSPPHRAASSPVRDDEEDEQDHQQDDDEDEHDDEQGQEQEQEVDEQEQHETQDVDMEDLVDSGSEDDYAATREAEDRQLKKARQLLHGCLLRQLKRRMTRKKIANSKPKSMGRECVEDDDGEQGGTSKPSRRLKKVKRNAAGAGEEEEEEEEEYKAGPIDKGSVNLLFRWKEELEEKVEELARDIRKPPSNMAVDDNALFAGQASQPNGQ